MKIVALIVLALVLLGVLYALAILWAINDISKHENDD